MRIISIGEILWDVYGDKEFVGGAPFNFSVHSRILGHKVYFISAIGDDNRGDRALQCTSDYGLSTKYISRVDNYPTGNVEVIKGAVGLLILAAIVLKQDIQSTGFKGQITRDFSARLITSS